MGAWVSSPGNDDEPARAAGKPRRGFRRLSLKLRLLIAVPLVALLLCAIVVSAALISYTIRFPDPMALRKRDTAPVVRVLARDGTILVERGQGGGYIPIDLIPPHLIDAVVATEDRRFFDHWGVDPWGLVRATFANLRAGRYAQGGSTLSQQLAKNLFLSPERTMGRKLEELLASIWLEVRLSKQDILELYLNRVYFGGGAYGIEAASHRYFGKGARNLDRAEAAILAGLLKAPSRFSPLSNPGLARARGRSVLRKMADAGLLKPAEEQAAIRTSVRFADPETGRETHGLDYAIEFVLDRLPPLAGTGPREIIVETTFEAGLQRHAQAVVERTLAAHGAEAGASQAALVVLDTDGGIRAMVGGRSFAQSQFNRATRASRQPGSSFKPLVYLTAIEQGATPDTQVLDAPISLGGWSPRNDNGQHRGLVTLRQALAHSINTVAVRVQQEVGLRRVIATARRLGIKSELRPDASLALGTSEVTLLELSRAYAMLASGGLAVEPHAIRKVRTAAGEIIYQRPPPRPRMVIAPDHAGAVSSMLHTVLASGTGRRAALPRIPAAGKTGTSQDHRDAWFLGYTAHLAGGVWVGNDSGEPMNRVTGGGLSAGIWREVMQEAHAKLPWLPLPGVDDMLEEKPHTPDAPVAQPAKPVPASEPRARAAFSPKSSVPPTARIERPRPAPAPAVAAGPRPVPIEPEPQVRALVTTPIAEPPPSLERDAIARMLAGDPPPGRMSLGIKPRE